MNEAIIIWLYLSLGSILGGGVAFTIVVLTGIALFFSAGFYFIEDIKEVPDYWRNYYPLKTVILIVLLTIFYPSKDDLKYIIGGAVVWNGIEAAQDIEGINELPANLVKAANDFLEKVEEK